MAGGVSHGCLEFFPGLQRTLLYNGDGELHCSLGESLEMWKSSYIWHHSVQNTEGCFCTWKTRQGMVEWNP